MTRHHELTKDGSTWFWFPDLAEEGEAFAGCWVPQLQCDGYIVAVEGIALYTEAQCQAWISEAVKAAPDPARAGAVGGNGRGGQTQAAAVNEAARQVLDLARNGAGLAKSHEFLMVLRDLYLAGKVAASVNGRQGLAGADGREQP